MLDAIFKAIRFHRRSRDRAFGAGVKGRVNVSKTGASVSARRGPVTVNSRGYVTIKTPIKGLQLRKKLF